MAIRLRRGNNADFDPNKLIAGELGLVLDAGKLYFCYSAGNTKQLTTADEIQTLLNAAPAAYTALQQVLVDLANNPSELTNILNNITALQTGKIDKTSIIQTTATNDSTKVPSSAVTYGLQQSVTAISDNLAAYKKNVYNGSVPITSAAPTTITTTAPVAIGELANIRLSYAGYTLPVTIYITQYMRHYIDASTYISIERVDATHYTFTVTGSGTWGLNEITLIS
jgi:hypothetical protein